MTDHEVEQRLRAWFRNEVGFNEPAPVTLRAELADVVDLPAAGRSGSPSRLVLIAVAALLTVAAIGSVIAIGSGLFRTPRPSPLSENGVIAFSRLDDANRGGIYVVNPDGSGLRLVTSAISHGRVSWSPDGTQFAFANSDGVHVMNADGTGQRSLVTDRGEYVAPAWSPDGRLIAFSLTLAGPAPATWDIYAVSADGSDLQQLTDGPGLDLATAWSPEGTRLVFMRETAASCPSKRVRGDPCYADDLFIMRADGSGLRHLLGDAGIIGYPTWSPDGTQIAFSQRPFPAGGGLPTSYNPPWDIWVLNVGDSTTRALTTTERSELSPTWSPDGKRIAFAANTDGVMSIEVMDADGSNVERLTTLSGFYGDPSWSVVNNP